MNFLLVLLTSLLFIGASAHTTYTVTQGWNLLGATEAISNLENFFQNGSVLWTYQENQWDRLEITEENTIEKGAGFWFMADASTTINTAETTNNPSEVTTTMQISIQSNGNTTLFQLNDSQAAQALYDQLPLSIAVENYSSNEKIFYPPNKLTTANTPLANAQTGTLAYYAPWGDVVMFYGDFGSAGGLYELGEATSGAEHIRNMSGTVTIEKAN